MGTNRVIFLNILLDFLAQLPGGMKFVDVDQVRFQAPEPAFNHDIVRPAGLTIHALLGNKGTTLNGI